jgi:hypothetical protein
MPAFILFARIGIAESQSFESGRATGTGEYVAFMDQDDRLGPYALHYIVEAMQQDKPDLLYSDEDRLDEHERRVEPVFKPDGHRVVAELHVHEPSSGCPQASRGRGGLVSKRFRWEPGLRSGAAHYDRKVNVRHVPRVLYHWRKHAGSTAASAAASRTPRGRLRALRDTVSRRRYDAECEKAPSQYVSLARRVAGNVKVSW